jgi:hypothetical protein
MSNLEMSHESKERAESFCILTGLDPEKFLVSGVYEALKVFDEFVKHLPRNLLDPIKFGKVMQNNPELLYSLLEASGTSIVSELNELRDQVKDAHAMMENQRIDRLELLRDVAPYFKTVKYCLGTDEDHEEVSVLSEDETEDLPFWKITIALKNGTKITNILDHIEASQYFPGATIVEEDPDPNYDGPDSFDRPTDDIDFASDDDHESSDEEPPTWTDPESHI